MVDSRLKLRGIKGVVGAFIKLTVIKGDANIPTILIAENMIKQETLGIVKSERVYDF